MSRAAAVLSLVVFVALLVMVLAFYGSSGDGMTGP
jgi:hypothetical protein